VVTIACWLVSATLMAQPQSGSEAVGPFGDILRWRIQGLETLGVDEVRDALAGDTEVLLAAHPRAPLTDLGTTVCERLRAGMLNSGRADAKVTCAVDHDQKLLTLQIAEGPVYRCGDVRISGLAEIPREPLLQRLTQPFPPEEAVSPVFSGGGSTPASWLDKDGKTVKLSDPVWPQGEPARLAEATRKHLRSSIEKAFADLGYHHVQFSIDLPCDAQTQRATLLIQIQETGPTSRIGSIAISGNQRSTDQAILAYLALEPGQVFTRGREVQLEYQLWRSGRFLEQEFQLQGVPTRVDGETVVALELEVIESPHAPPIDQPLSREAEALLKTRDWLIREQDWRQDLVLTIRSEPFAWELVQGPGQGVWFQISRPDSQPPARATLLVSADRFGFFAGDEQDYFEVPAPQLYFDFLATVKLNEARDDDAKLFSIGFGLGFHSEKQSPADAPFEATWDLHPAAAVAMPGSRLTEHVWTGDRLELRGAAESLTIDASSGRVLEYSRRSDQEQVRLVFEDDAYARRTQALAAARPSGKNVYAPDRKLTSTLGYFCALGQRGLGSLELTPAQRANYELALGVAQTLVGLDLLRTIDQRMLESTEKPASTFRIPFGPLAAGQPAGYPAMLARLVPGLAEQGFPRDSWPWTVCREAAFAAMGKGAYTGAEVQRIYTSNQVGPICRWVVSLLMLRVDERMSRLLALRGLSGLGIDDFRNDYQPLLDPNYVTGQFLQHATQVLRSVDSAAIDRLVVSFPEHDQGWLNAALIELRSNPDRSWDAALTSALDVAWETGLNARVEQGLKELRDRNAFRVGMDLRR
jgi:hypothetical protein